MKIYPRTVTACLIVVVGLLMGCTDQQKPEDLIAENTYVKLLVELQLVESAADQDTVNQEQLVNRIYEKYDVTQEQFLRSHRYYSDQIPQQKKRIKQALKRLRQNTEVETDSTRRSRRKPIKKRNANL